MTEENGRENARGEMALARDAIEAAELLAREGRWRHVTSRAYYAAFHAARALLFAVGVEPRSHEGLRREFGRHYVVPGRVAPEWARLLGRMARARQDADYETFSVITEEMARADLDDAQRFVAEADRILAAGGGGARRPG